MRSAAIFNMDIGPLVEEHKAHRAKNRNWLLTAVFWRGTVGYCYAFIAVESGSGTLIKYEERCSMGLSIDVRAESAGLDLGGSVEVYSDVVDTGLDVCTPEVLIDVKDNF